MVRRRKFNKDSLTGEARLGHAGRMAGLAIPRDLRRGNTTLLFFFITLGPELSDTTGLRAVNTSPPRNCFSFLRSNERNPEKTTPVVRVVTTPVAGAEASGPQAW